MRFRSAQHWRQTVAAKTGGKGRWHVSDLVFHCNRRKLRVSSLPAEVNMELAVVVVVLLVAGASIPGDWHILFYR
jgi:hypothetical protein